MNQGELLGLMPEAFKSVVNNDIRGECDSETEQALRSQDVCRRWYNMLVSTKRSIETQLATFRIERVQKANSPDYEPWLQDKLKWRAGALRFKSSVEEKIAEAKEHLRAETNQAEKYRHAILDHQTACVATDGDPDHDVDRALWSVVS